MGNLRRPRRQPNSPCESPARDGVEALPLRGRCIKTASDDLRQVVTNYDELYAQYKGTHYQLMLDEVPVPADGGD